MSKRQIRCDIIQVGHGVEPAGYQGELHPEGWGMPGRHYIAKDFDELVKILRELFGEPMTPSSEERR